MSTPHQDTFELGGERFTSRLLLGTGKFKDLDETRAALAASGTEIVTVALRRLDPEVRGPSLLDLLREPRPSDGGRAHYLPLPNTAGCYTVEDALRTARLGRELGLGAFVKLEVIGDKKTLFPDAEATLVAAKQLVAEGFVVLPYTNDDPIMARKLADVGCAAVMPLAAPIGSGLGITSPHNLSIIVEQSRVPVIVDAGVGTASDAAVAMELGCQAILMNTAIAHARDPVLMATAMREAVGAGRKAFLAGRMPKSRYANASSPTAGLIE